MLVCIIDTNAVFAYVESSVYLFTNAVVQRIKVEPLSSSMEQSMQYNEMYVPSNPNQSKNDLNLLAKLWCLKNKYFYVIVFSKKDK